MASGVFYRTVRARDHLELFLLSAISSLLLLRLYLQLTGYPQVGGSLHIAHMLWGGALMLAALVITLSFIGARSQRIVAICGGIGFGIFIDEIGKFITKDNNYFYRPAIGIIYAIFVILYLLFNFLSRKQPLTSREYQLNALNQLEEAVVRDMDSLEKAQVTTLLANADQNDPITKQLQTFLGHIKANGKQTQPTVLRRMLDRLNAQYEHFWQLKNSTLLVRLFFIAEALFFVISISWIAISSLNDVIGLLDKSLPFSRGIIFGEMASALTAGFFALWGAVLLPRSRERAYEQFRRSALINIFLTQFFMFLRIEFGALPSFFLNLLLLGAVGYAIRQERRLSMATAQK
jgi:hypothetical protein